MEMERRGATMSRSVCVYIYISVDFSKECVWDIHMNKATEKGQGHGRKIAPDISRREF